MSKRKSKPDATQYCHLVPQVYQKSWHTSRGKNNVYYFSKDNINKPISNDGGNIGNNLGVDDEYIITAEDSNNGLTDFAKPDEIEQYFANGIEQKWNNVLISNIFEWLENVAHKPGTIAAIKAEDLVNTPFEKDFLDFVILQQLRIFENFMEFDNGTINNLLIDNYNRFYEAHPTLPKDNLDELLANIGYKKTIWKSIIKNCMDNGDSFLALLRKQIFPNYNLTFCYLKKDIRAKFILSDNPIIWNCGKTKKHEALESGIFLPINPNCMAVYLCYDRKDIALGDVLCVFPKNQFVKYINYILLKQSREQIGFMDKNVKDHISNKFNKNYDWDEMFQ